MSIINVAIPYISCPTTNNINKRNFLPKNIRKLIYAKRRHWKKFHIAELNDPLYAIKRAKYKLSCKIVKKAIYNYRCSELSNLSKCKNPKKIFQYINKRIKNNSRIHNLRSNDGNVLESDENKANLLNATFVNNFTPCNSNTKVDSTNLNNDGFIINITYDEVLQTLCNVPSGAAGPDGLNGEIIRSLAPLIAKPMFIIYQQSIFTGIFPSAWKRARIAPIYKSKGSRDDPSSYRPISICDILGKCLEKIIVSQMIIYIEDNNLLCNIQHGFRVGRSTVTNLLVTDKYIAEWTNSSIPFDIISFDLSKAFDRVPHNIIINLLHSIGFHISSVTWFQNFLSNRSQFVQLGSATSPDLPVSSGTIQGSSVGPVLWALFINQLAIRLKVPSVLFADDLKFLFNLHEISNDEGQAEIDSFSDWCIENHVEINADKSACLHSSATNNTKYTCCKKPIPSVESFKDLGVMRSANGSYELHYDFAVCKAKRISASILKNIVIPNYNIGWRLFQAFVQPMLLYASVAWNPLAQGVCNIVESVQRRYSKKLPRLSGLTYQQRLHALQSTSSEATRIRNDMIFAYKVIHGLVPFSPHDFGFKLSDHSRTPLFVLQLIRREQARHFARFRIPSQWNSLPANIRGASSLYTFKKLLNSWLLVHDPAFT